MKLLPVLLIAGATLFAAVPSVNAATVAQTYTSAESVLIGDTRAARLMRSYKRDGFQEVNRQYSQVMYFVAPTQDYKTGEYVITYRKSSGNYSLTSYYAEVHIEVMADVETGRFFTGRVWSEESVVY